MGQGGVLESLVSEYRTLLVSTARGPDDSPDAEGVIRGLVAAHAWTEEGAQTIVSLANEYGAFMLRNTLALAIALGREDGDRGF